MEKIAIISDIHGNLEDLKSDKIKEEIIENCKKNISKYGVPKEIEFRDALPKTLVGKVAYRQLEEEEAAKYEQAKTE